MNNFFHSPSNIISLCIINNLLENINNNEYRNLDNDNFKQTIVTSKEKLERIHKIKFSDYIHHIKKDINKDKNYVCPITLNPINSNTFICELKCGHLFEYDALYKWLSTKSNKCPCCRCEL